MPLRFDEGDYRTLDDMTTSFPDSFSSLPQKGKRKASKEEEDEGEIVQARRKNLSRANKMKRTATQDPTPRYNGGYDSGDTGGVAESSRNVFLPSTDPQFYAMGGKMIEPTVQYVQKHRCNLPHHGPSRYDEENAQHETFRGSYTNQGQHASGQGIINNFNPQTINCNCNFSNPLQELKKRCSHSAAVDSAARFDPPRCAESTRLTIVRIIEKWVDSNGDDAMSSSLFWLYGGAGAGKSALAQSLSENYQKKKQLAATFFFFRGDATRNNGDHLIPTLVSHLFRTVKRIIPFVEARIQEDWDLFTKTYQTQIQELLVEPLLALKSNGHQVIRPRLIVIDGLDECENLDIQCELLRALASAILKIPYPLRFLVTSRPEAHIARVFDHDPDLQAIPLHRYNLSEDPDNDMDIRKFLAKEFADIRRVHSIGQRLPHDWPEQKAITSLVERSSGHFIYASTVIRYIRSPKHRPDDRLEVILRLRPPQEGDRPYGQLDALFALIFQGVRTCAELEKICLVFGILYFQSKQAGLFTPPFPYTIENLLEMKPGDLVLLLEPVLSLVALDGDNVRILHRSLFDYLLDVTRCGNLPFDLVRVHEVAAIHILNQKIVKNTANVFDAHDFAYHCQYAYLNVALKDWLHSLEAPYPNFITSLPLSDDQLNIFVELITGIWHIFRTLTREDFDFTKKVYKQYLAKYAGKRYSGQMCLQPQHPAGATIVDLKLKLDTQLSEWKPSSLDQMGEVKNRRIALIEQEHSVFSTCAREFFSGTANVITSSLVFGDCFIHSYDLGISPTCSSGFLILRTYFKYGNAYHQYVSVNRTSSINLEKIEMCLFADLYQKCGLEPDWSEKSWPLSNAPSVQTVSSTTLRQRQPFSRLSEN